MRIVQNNSSGEAYVVGGRERQGAVQHQRGIITVPVAADENGGIQPKNQREKEKFPV